MKQKIIILSLFYTTFVLLLLMPSVLWSQSLEDLYNVAKKEGGIKFYTSGYPPLNKFIVERFKAKYPGVEVEVFRNQTAALAQTIETQRMANRVDADVISHTDEGFYDKWKKEKFLMKYKTLNWDLIPAGVKDPEGYWIAYRATIVIPCYNPQVISSQDVPKSFQDFLDPKWRSKIVAVHPEFGSSAMTFWKSMVDLYGWQYIEKLKSQNLLFVRGHGDVTRMIITKERPIAIEQLAYNTVEAQGKGQPIEHVFIPGVVVPVTVAPVGMYEKTKHPNAAKLFVNFLLDIEIQNQLPIMEGMYAARPDVAPPKGLRKLSEYKLIPVDVEWLNANRDVFIKKFNEMMGRM